MIGSFSQAFLWAGVAATLGVSTAGADAPNPRSAAAQIDVLIADELTRSKTPIAPMAGDEDFLRRATFDLAGTTPSPRDVTLFGLNPDSAKRAKLIDRLVASDEFATNWARYWRDVIFTRATNQRALFARGGFEAWLTEQLKQNRSWDKITTDLLTASGDIRENGATGLIYAHDGQAEELAAEVSRIFLGIQIQCANCHDHPTDVWKREQFHQFAAFFPRIRVRPIREENRVRSYEIVSLDRAPNRGRRNQFRPDFFMRFFDRNRDGKVTQAEVKGTRAEQGFGRLLRTLDKNNDGALTLAEVKNYTPPQQNNARTRTEHFMPDLADPGSQGKQMEPVFFVGTSHSKPGDGLRDMQRRETISKALTSKDNKWYARAFVNRIWAEMLGEGFYMPIDDIGPQREARYPKVLELLADGFIASGYDVKWLFRTVANTTTYQRQIRARTMSDTTPPFASAAPTRLRADQVYSALTKVLGIPEPAVRSTGRGMYRRGASGRAAFSQLFGYDPSTPQEDITGNIPQALFMMNSTFINSMVRSTGGTRLAQILREHPQNKDAIAELYLLVLAREASAKELAICEKYIAKVGTRGEGFEDVMWGLLNSSEFLSKR